MIAATSDTLDELSSKIIDAFNVEVEISFARLKGGYFNDPLLVSKMGNGEHIPICVIKKSLMDSSYAAMQLRAMDQLQRNGFEHIPKVFGIGQKYLSQIGEEHYSFVEYIEEDPIINRRSFSIDDILRLIGKFHRHANGIEFLAGETHLERLTKKKPYFTSPKSDWHINLIGRDRYELLKSLFEFYTSREFIEIYSKLPKQLIHGDTFVTNFIPANNKPFLIDFDTIAYDIRLYDVVYPFKYDGTIIRFDLAQIPGVSLDQAKNIYQRMIELGLIDCHGLKIDNPDKARRIGFFSDFNIENLDHWILFFLNKSDTYDFSFEKLQNPTEIYQILENTYNQENNGNPITEFEYENFFTIFNFMVIESYCSFIHEIDKAMLEKNHDNEEIFGELFDRHFRCLDSTLRSWNHYQGEFRGYLGNQLEVKKHEVFN
ncbi:MAG: aminoglycoside phosphotransferase family protein [Nanoarchaeota archaeon]